MIFSVGGYAPDIHPTAFIHPTAEISGKVRIGANASIWGQCVLRGDIDWITVGEESNVQDGCVFHTSAGAPVVLEKGVTVGHKAMIHGATVRSYSLIGMSATLLDGSLVEENCLIGAGALVKERGVIPAGSLAAGVPAKILRAVKPEETKLIVARAADYVRYAETYRAALKSAGLTA